jgi:alkanesulfonate monooxygenase SsuD/methylene tetrahydromethanopterin reductase-like flavin-dependent oxidoreductase (luciferase family)
MCEPGPRLGHLVETPAQPLPDHVLPPCEFGGELGGVYEALVTIAHLAAFTQRLRLGTSVLVAPLRDPFVLAKQVATLHRLSSGRVILGLGVGWAKEEFDALGVDYSRRGAITDDVLTAKSSLRWGFCALPEPPVLLRMRGVRADPRWQGAGGAYVELRGLEPLITSMPSTVGLWGGQP